MIPSNFHTHTTRCHHAYGTEEEYVLAAIAVGMKELGFSDHAPVPFKDYVSGIRMTMDEAKGYVDTIRDLAERYKDKIKIYVGFEAEYLPKYFDEQMAFYDELGIDYLIMGQHFVHDEATGVYTGRMNCSEELLSDYVDAILKGLKTGRFKYVAHPDLIYYMGEDEIYNREMTRLAYGIKELGYPIEINALGLKTNRNYPDKRFLKIAGEAGLKAVVGMDAHRVSELDDQDIYDECVRLLNEFGIEQTFLKL